MQLKGQRQKGPRAYIVYAHGKAVAVVDMAKDARVIVRKYKSQALESSYIRYSSRLIAEERAAWHNHEQYQWWHDSLSTTG